MALEQRRLTEPIKTEEDFPPPTGLEIEDLESTWSHEFQHPFEFSLEIISEQHEPEPGKMNLSFLFQRPTSPGNLSFSVIQS
jgi:hypothetical protein